MKLEHGETGARDLAARIQTGTSGAMVAGSITVTGVTITAASKIQVTRAVKGGTLGHVDVAVSTRTAGAAGSGQFIITSSSGTETSTFDYVIFD